MKTIIFTCDKKDVDSGQFPIEHLKILSVNTGMHIIIKKFAEIVKGEVRYMQ